MPDAKEVLEREAEERKKSNEEAAKRMESAKPTPTQEENDLARLGQSVEQKQDDGSGPEPKWRWTVDHEEDDKQRQSKQIEARPGQPGYATRQARPQQPPQS